MRVVDAGVVVELLATYVALAELVDTTALLTTDARLAQAPGPRCTIRLL